jgi:hypothetical protein
MKTVALATMAAILMSGSAMAAPSYKAPTIFKSFRAPALTPFERMQIQQSQHRLNLLQWRVRADGRVTVWERIQVRLAQNRHNALVYRLSHN